MLFLGIVVVNVLIGIVQELRVKHALDRVSLLSAPTATVVRDGRTRTIPAQELVLDDIVLLAAGDQVCADAILCQGGAEVNEALLTGEADPVPTGVGDPLLDVYKRQALSRRQQQALVMDNGWIEGHRAAWAACRVPPAHPRVLYQGEPGAYADEAAARFFGEDIPCLLYTSRCV